MDIKTALADIRKDPKLKKSFIENPSKTMTKLGFNTKKLVINPKNKLGFGANQATTVCASVGCVVCGSVGTDV